MRRPTVGEAQCCDAAVVARRLEVSPGPGAVTVNLDRDRPPVVLQAVPSPFGSVRWWWCCPTCGVRRLSLYRRDGGDWACRVCLGLTYQSRRNMRPWEAEVRELVSDPAFCRALVGRWRFPDLRELVGGQPDEWTQRRQRHAEGLDDGIAVSGETVRDRPDDG
jgi:hypothetical protein